jgi:hypothetical protein
MADIVEEMAVRPHRIRVKLYENHMAAIKGKHIAKMENGAMVTIPEVCAALKDRDLYHGDIAELARLFMLVMREAGRQMRDGFGINFRFFSVLICKQRGLAGNGRGIADSDFWGRDSTDSTDSKFDSNADLRGIS